MTAIPCCCLVPSDAAGLIIGRAGATVRRICDESKAQVNVSGERDTPKALSDRIVTIQGTPEQIELACREVIRIVHQSQELDAEEDGIFVTVVPCGAVEHVVGPGGDTIRELVETIGAEVNISRNGIVGTELQPVSVAGTPKQMLEATMKVLGLVQELADKGGLTIDSYSWPRRPPASATPSQALSRSSTPVRAGSTDGTPRRRSDDSSVASVLFVVSSSAAAWVVGRAGRTVSELRAKSGASLEVARNGGPLRLVEVRGTRTERQKAVELLLDTIEELPAGPPRETQLLAPPNAVLEMGDLQRATHARVQVENLGPEGADGFGTGSGCRLIVLSGPREAVREAAIHAAAMLGEAFANPAVGMQATCSNCGAVFSDDAAFCKRCGHKREVEAQPRRPGRTRSVSPVASIRNGHNGSSQRALSVGASRFAADRSSDGETELLKALLAGPMPQAAHLELLLPADFVRLCLESGSHLQTVALRTGSHVDLAPPGPEAMRMVTVSGAMLGNSMAVLKLQELLQQYQGF